MLSDEPLDSSESHHLIGSGHASELQMRGIDRDAWESVTGYRPVANTVAACLAEHLLFGADPTGQDFARPLTAGFTRNLDVWLGDKVWSHTIQSSADELALPAMRVEADGLAQVYREQGETQYRLAMGALRAKYRTGPIKDLIAFLFRAGRDDLPLMDELNPQTVKSESWPNVGGPNDNAFTGVVWNQIGGGAGTWSVGTVGKVTVSGSGFLRLDYVFGGNDRDCSFTTQSVTNLYGLAIRSDANAGNDYDFGGFNGSRFIEKCVSNAATTLHSSGTGSIGDVRRATMIGSTYTHYSGGSQLGTGTDTAITTGTRSGCLGYVATSVGICSFDDLVSASSTVPVFMNQYRQRWR